MRNDILVNKFRPLPRDYEPNSLVSVTSDIPKEHLDPNHKIMIVDHVLTAFNKMRNDIKKQGFDIEIDSGYRSFEYQVNLLNQALEEKGEDAYKTLAIPGTSEHQTGLAIDFCITTNNIYNDDIKGDEPETIWVHAHAPIYGFILRLPKDKVDITGFNYEPWHLRYVGSELACYLTTYNLTLEEYHQEKTLLTRAPHS